MNIMIPEGYNPNYTSNLNIDYSGGMVVKQICPQCGERSIVTEITSYPYMTSKQFYIYCQTKSVQCKCKDTIELRRAVYEDYYKKVRGRWPESWTELHGREDSFNG